MLSAFLILCVFSLAYLVKYFYCKPITMLTFSFMLFYPKKKKTNSNLPDSYEVVELKIDLYTKKLSRLNFSFVLHHKHYWDMDQQAPWCYLKKAKVLPARWSWFKQKLEWNEIAYCIFIHKWSIFVSCKHTHITKLLCELSKACLPVMSSNRSTP